MGSKSASHFLFALKLQYQVVYCKTILWYTMITKWYIPDLKMKKTSYESGIQDNKALESTAFCIKNID